MNGTDEKLGPVVAALLVSVTASQSPQFPEAAPTVQAPRRHEHDLPDEGPPAISASSQDVTQAPPTAAPRASQLMTMGVG